MKTGNRNIDKKLGVYLIENNFLLDFIGMLYLGDIVTNLDDNFKDFNHIGKESELNENNKTFEKYKEEKFIKKIIYENSENNKVNDKMKSCLEYTLNNLNDKFKVNKSNNQEKNKTPEEKEELIFRKIARYDMNVIRPYRIEKKEIESNETFKKLTGDKSEYKKIEDPNNPEEVKECGIKSTLILWIQFLVKIL